MISANARLDCHTGPGFIEKMFPLNRVTRPRDSAQKPIPESILESNRIIRALYSSLIARQEQETRKLQMSPHQARTTWYIQPLIVKVRSILIWTSSSR